MLLNRCLRHTCPGIQATFPACRRNQAAVAQGHNCLEGECRFSHEHTREYAFHGCGASAPRGIVRHKRLRGECRAREARTHDVHRTSPFGKEGVHPRGVAPSCSSRASGLALMCRAASAPNELEERRPRRSRQLRPCRDVA